MTYFKQYPVPTADATSNAFVNDVVGNKTDASSVTVGTEKSLMAYTKGILNTVVAMSGDLFTVSSLAVGSVDVDNSANVGYSIVDPNSGPFASADITAGTYDLERVRAGATTTIATGAAFSKMDGLIYATITFATADWDADDLYIVVPQGDQRVSIGGVSHYVNCSPLSGYITDLSTVQTGIDTTNTNLGAIADGIDRDGNAIEALHDINRVLENYLTGTAEAGSNATTIVDASFVGYADDYFNGEWIVITSGTYDKEFREITDFDGTSGTFTIASFSGAIGVGDTFMVLSRLGAAYFVIGRNNSDNNVDTELVMPGDDGSLLERVEYIQRYLTDSLNGTEDAGSAATTVTDAGLAGYGDDFFNNWWIYVRTGARAGQTRVVTDYDSGTGVFTTAAFTGALGIGDTFELFSPAASKFNLVGENLADNYCDTSLVTANADGSLVERQEYVQTAIDDGTSGLAAIKTAVTAVNTDLDDFSSQVNLQSALAALGVPDVAGKSLYVCLVTDRLDSATYGLSALNTDLDAILADVGDASASTLGSIYAILGNPGTQAINTQLGYGAAGSVSADLTTVKTALAGNETVSSYSYLDAGGEQDVLTLSPGAGEQWLVHGVWLDTSAMTQNGTVKFYYKVDNSNYVLCDSEAVLSTDTGMWLPLNMGITSDFKITYTESVDETAARTIYYQVIYEVR